MKMMEGATGLEPPFKRTAVAKTPKCVHPGAITHEGGALIRPYENDEMKGYLNAELKPTRLDKIYRHLHYAGSPRASRALHRQIIVGRKIVITEDVSEHLVWKESGEPRIFLKPFGAYLLDYSFWEEYLCLDRELHRSACGFVLSYVWLVSRESDFRIAMHEKLFPSDLEWETWTEFVRSFTSVINTKSLHQVARRYQYGELRLKRLDRIYRYTPTAFSLRNLFGGFMASSRWYRDVFYDNFGWVLSVFAVVTIALSGMQVALMTDQLGHDSRFHRASYGFAVFSLVALAASLGIIFGTWVVLTLYFYIHAKLYHHRVQAERRKMISSPA